MVVALFVVSCLFYVSGALTMLGLLGHETVLHPMQSSVSFLGGTVALASAAILHELEKIRERLYSSAPSQE